MKYAEATKQKHFNHTESQNRYRISDKEKKCPTKLRHCLKLCQALLRKLV